MLEHPNKTKMGQPLTTFRMKVAVAKAEQMEKIQRFKLEQLRRESAK